jgi:hypothetical protein
MEGNQWLTYLAELVTPKTCRLLRDKETPSGLQSGLQALTGTALRGRLPSKVVAVTDRKRHWMQPPSGQANPGSYSGACGSLPVAAA